MRTRFLELRSRKGLVYRHCGGGHRDPKTRSMTTGSVYSGMCILWSRVDRGYPGSIFICLCVSFCLSIRLIFDSETEDHCLLG